jgi:succinate-semialdehyde dehydrogenase/glutarate-semialdehyde dehydrogenase
MTLNLPQAELMRSQNFIGGRWCAAAAGGQLAVLNPADESPIAQVPDSAAADAGAAVDAAQGAFTSWRATPAKRRAQLLKRWNALILAHQGELGRLISLEQGKPWNFRPR